MLLKRTLGRAALHQLRPPRIDLLSLASANLPASSATHRSAGATPGAPDRAATASLLSEKSLALRPVDELLPLLAALYDTGDLLRAHVKNGTELAPELPPLARAGHGSLKVFLTYDRLRVEDVQFLDVLDAARKAIGKGITVAGVERR